MAKYFYIENEEVTDENYQLSVDYAIQLKKKDRDIGRIIILIPTKNQYSLLNPFFPHRQANKADHIIVDGVIISVFTIRTYRPYTMSISGKDILITIGLDPEQFEKFEDEEEIKHIIHIPWSMDISEEWIKSHNAINIKTGVASTSTVTIDPWVKKAIDWLAITSYPNKGFYNDYDKDRLKSTANALNLLETSINAEAIRHYCQSISLSMEAASKMIDYFRFSMV